MTYLVYDNSTNSTEGQFRRDSGENASWFFCLYVKRKEATNMKIAFLGFGEADSSICRGLHENGTTGMWGYDLVQNNPDKRDKMLAKMAECGAAVAAGPEELAKDADIIITAIPSQFAVGTCESIAKYLEPKTIYLDVSTASPLDKQKICAMVEAQGAKMVDGAMLGALLQYKHRVPMLLAGSAAQECKEMMEPLGMDMTVVEGKPGTATSIKFLRSVVAKGLMALLFECMQAAQYFGVEDTIVDSLLESYGVGFEKKINSYISGTSVHALRRQHEMENVLDMLKEANLPCDMTEACVTWMGRIAEADIPSRFPGEEVPKAWKDVLAGWGLNDNK